jgi:N-sulfoglucosamine sulfohydrolase
MKPAVNDLELLLKDTEGAVRIAAAEALHELGKKEEGFSALLLALKHDNLFVRVQALNVLQSLGDEAKPAIAHVHQLLPSGPPPNPGQDTAYDIRAARSFLESFGR